MKAAKLRLNELEASFRSVIGPDDRVVVVTAALWTFGSALKVKPRHLPAVVQEVLESVIGPERSLVMPTYTNYYARERHFDLKLSRPETGILAEHFLTDPAAVRTPSAMDSYAVKGPAAAEIGRMQGRTVWGRGSVKEWFEKVNARMCSLGLPLLGGPYILGTNFKAGQIGFFHRAEEVFGVPYRYYKSFRGTWADNGQDRRPWVETMFVRPLGVPLVVDHNPLIERLNERGRVLGGDGPVVMQSAPARDIVDASLELFQEDPYAFIANKDEVQPWVKNEKADEMAALAPEESPPADLLAHA